MNISLFSRARVRSTYSQFSQAQVEAAGRLFRRDGAALKRGYAGLNVRPRGVVMAVQGGRASHSSGFAPSFSRSSTPLHFNINHARRSYMLSSQWSILARRAYATSSSPGSTEPSTSKSDQNGYPSPNQNQNASCSHPTCPSNNNSSETAAATAGPSPSTSSDPPSPPDQHHHHHPLPDYPSYIQRLLRRLPHLHAPALPLSTSPSSPDATSNPSNSTSTSTSNPSAQHHLTHARIPTKDDLLSATNSFWQRLRIRWKWFTVRGWRRYRVDEWGAFLSWFVVGNTIWIIIGTTTFFSVLLATLNSLSLQERVAKLLSDYLTRNTGFIVVFEEAIVPRWRDGRLRLGKVFVSRRPEQDEGSGSGGESDSGKLLKALGRGEIYPPVEGLSEGEKGESNYTMFDLNIEEVEVVLSLPRWLDGKGLVQDAKVKGVRGVIDRRHVHWDTSKPLVPADFRHPSHAGDFELENLEIEDFLVTVYQPGGQRPFNVSIFNADIGPFRKRWMFFDMLSAVGITGQYDNCLFSLHKPQKLGKSTLEEKDARIKRLARFRIDGLPIEHAQYATGFQGPMSWITSGKLDAVLDIKFPRHPDEEVDLNAILNHLGKNVAEIAKDVIGDDADEIAAAKAQVDARAAAEAAQNAMTATRKLTDEGDIIPGQHRLAKPALRAPDSESQALSDWELAAQKELREREVNIDIDMRFRDIKAAVPLFSTDLSVSNNAFIRPIVAFMNANRTLIPIHCSVIAPLSDFDGSWTLFETGLTSSVATQMHAALIHHVSSSQANRERIRTVGAWGVQRGAEAVLNMVRTVVDPIHAQAAMASPM